jgi:hypothetical protein
MLMKLNYQKEKNKNYQNFHFTNNKNIQINKNEIFLWKKFIFYDVNNNHKIFNKNIIKNIFINIINNNNTIVNNLNDFEKILINKLIQKHNNKQNNKNNNNKNINNKNNNYLNN